MFIFRNNRKMPVLWMMLCCYLWMIPSVFAATDCSSQGDIPPIQCQALVDLYTSTNGASWTDNATNKWNTDNFPCTWTGVTCSGGFVTQIARTSQNLTGTLPTNLSDLDHLTLLGLNNNYLTGSIPTLPASLISLGLDTNQFTGTIPALPTNSKWINLGGNQLTGSIPTFPNSLLSIILDYNQLTGTIPTLPTGLTGLSLNANKLSGVIPTLPASLTTLKLANNAFTETLPSLASLTGLTSPNLDLSYNALTGAFTGEDALVLSKQATWKNTQTVSPTNVTATTVSSTSVQVNWSPITYMTDGGYYQVRYATTPGGTYTNAASPTADKSTTIYTVTGLSPSTTYYFVVETFTPLHGLQQNNLTSASSQEVSAVIPSGTCVTTATVSSTADSGTGSLRNAVANLCADGIIDFAAGLANQTITLTSKITFAQNATLRNPNAPGLNISGNNAARLFHINAGITLSVDSLNIINGSAGTPTGSGGAFTNWGTLNFTNSTCKNNQAPGDGGCIMNHPSATLNFLTSLCDQNQAGGTYGGCISNEGTVTITGSSFNNNTVPSGGGGGAIFNTNSGTVNVNSSTFDNNSATSSGGAIFSNSGTVTVSGSTFSNNSASTYGGAIRNDATFTISNSTFFNNSSPSSAAIHNYAGSGSGTVTLINSTIANSSGYGVMNNSTGTLHLKNTLIANNSSGDCSNIGTMATNTSNFIKDSSCSPARSGDPQLATTLASNGAPATAPLTLALLSTSPAIDVGDVAVCSSAPINNLDQRGISRPQGSTCDIGAFEFVPTLPAAPTALQLISTSDTALQLTWTDNSNNETGFKIERNGVLLHTTAANVVSDADTGLTCSVTYSYRVSAFNEAGTSSAISGSFAMPPCTTPTASYQSQPLPNSTIDFGTVLLDATSQKILTLQEVGNAALIINKLQITGSDAAAFSIVPPLTTPFFIADGGANKPLTLQCLPTQAAVLSANLQLGTNDPANPTVSYPLTCTGQLNNFTLTINTTGSGSVAGCGSSCTQTQPQNTTVNMVATPASGWQFGSWSGDCVNGQVVMTANKTCTANFTQVTSGSTTFTLTVTTTGSGSVAGCGSNCTQTYAENSAVNLTATPATGWQLSSWSGDCNNGQVVMTANKTCTANFISSSSNLTVLTINTTGSGSINGCGSSCSQTHLQNATVMLVATPATGWQLSSWSGDCNNGQVVMSANKACTANFTQVTSGSSTFTLMVNTVGSGSIAGCGNSCTQTHPQNTTVTLTATPATGWQLGNWSGDCVNGQVMMTANKTCTATFSAMPSEPTSPGTSATGIPTVAPVGGTVTGNMSNYNQTATDLTVTLNGSVAGGTVAGTVTNNGLIANVTVAPDATVTGGELSGFNHNAGTVANITLSPYSELTGGYYQGTINNQGLIINPTILTDSMLQGGKVGGVVLNQGVLQDVTFLPETLILGGTLSGNMIGDALGYVIIGEANLTKIRLSRACLTATVQLDKEVVIDKTVIQHVQPIVTQTEIEDFCIIPDAIPNFTQQRILGTEKLAFSTFWEENVAELPPIALEALIAEQLANFRADSLGALRIEQYQHIPVTTFKGLHKDNMGGLNPQVIHEFDSAHLNALQLTEFQQMPAFGVAKWLTNLNANEVTPELITQMLPEGWQYDETTGSFTAPANTQLALKALELQAIPANLTLPKYQFDANSRLTVGGMGNGETLLQKINRTLRVQGLDYQAEQNKYGVIIGKDSSNTRQFAFMLDTAKLLQRGNNSVIGAQLDENGKYRVTTLDNIEVDLLPVPKNPVALLTALGASSRAVVGENGDVFLSITQSTTRRVRDGEFLYIVTLFDPFVEPSLSDFCSINAAGESECNWANAGADTQPGIHFYDGMRAKRQAKVIYEDGTAQLLYPTVFSPQTFIEEAQKFPGVEAVTFNMDGTFTVMYQGQKLQLFPNFGVTVTPLEKYRHVKPSVKLKGNVLEYQVQNGQQLLTTEVSLSQ